MDLFRLRDVLPSSIATDLATLLHTRMGEDEVRFAKFYMPGFVYANGHLRPERYYYTLLRLDDGGLMIEETIGTSADRMRLQPPLDGDWRSDAHPGWLTTAYNRLKMPQIEFYKNEPPRWGLYLRETE